MDNELVKQSDLSEGRSQFGLIVLRFKKNRAAVAALFIMATIILLVVAAPLYANYDDAVTQNIANRLQSPSSEHIFGTDAFGRDLFTRVVFGGRISLLAGLGVVISGLIFGTALGSIAGYFGGNVDTIIMRFVDIFMAVPPMLLSLAVVTALGGGTVNIIIALMVADIPRYARIVRSSILPLRSQEFIEACKLYGTGNARIIFKHILPNGIGPVVVTATLALGTAILTISALGFLGVGVPAPTPEWGTIIADNRFYIRFFPYLGIIPGIAIALSVMCVNLIGDGLRDALDPKMKK